MSNHTKRGPGRPPKRIRSDKYRVRSYTLDNATIALLEANVERGGRSSFIEEAILEKIERREWWTKELQKAVDEVTAQKSESETNHIFL